MTHHRPHDRDEARELRPEDEVDNGASARRFRATGGDAPGAGSIARREALAKDENSVNGPRDPRSREEHTVEGPSASSDDATQADAGLAGGGRRGATGWGGRG